MIPNASIDGQVRLHFSSGFNCQTLIPATFMFSFYFFGFNNCTLESYVEGRVIIFRFKKIVPV